MEPIHIIVVGAGASGLIAARDLLKAGYKVTIIEARNRLGGRIETVTDPRFSKPVELGAEFVHGNLPVTLELLHYYKLSYRAVTGKMLQDRGGKVNQENGLWQNAALLEKRLNEVREDISAEVFLDTYFAGPEFESFRNSIQGFIEGYDAADIKRASIIRFREEWLGEDEEQYRIDGGYLKLIESIAAECRMLGVVIHLSAPVSKVEWNHGEVKIHCHGNKIFEANKILITVPLGVLQVQQGQEGAITFSPDIPEKRAAALSLGYGHVIKIAMQFRETFWESAAIKKSTGQNMKKMGFMFTDALIPTWWTQLPDKSAIITGWAGGARAIDLNAKGEAAILDSAIDSLAYIFKQRRSFIETQLLASRFVMWDKDPYSRGGYAYATVNEDAHKIKLGRPLENTLFFGGEALYTGPATGTVEAALANGIEVAGTIINVQS